MVERGQGLLSSGRILALVGQSEISPGLSLTCIPYSCQGCRGRQPTIARWLATVGTPRSARQLNGDGQLNGNLWLSMNFVADHNFVA